MRIHTCVISGVKSLSLKQKQSQSQTLEEGVDKMKKCQKIAVVMRKLF